jgi:hypothetical protein
VTLEGDMERVAGHHEHRNSETSRELAVGTLACPGCDAPVLPQAAGMAPADAISCGFCGHSGAVRDFLSLGEPTRATHVVVRVRSHLDLTSRA